MIKAITFDLDGVYFLKGKENFIASLEKLGVSVEEAERVFLKSDQMNKLYKTGKMSGEEFWAWALGEWKLVNFTAPQIVELLIGGYEINRDAQTLVKDLRAKGYRTAICSNNFPERIRGLGRRFDFLKDFDVKVFSYEVGVTKPDPRIFEELVRRSGCAPEEIVYSDDDETKLTSATRLGIQAFVYENFPQFRRKLVDLGVAIG